MPVNVCIAGAGGRMGQRLLALAREDAALRVVAAVEQPGHPWIGRDPGPLAGLPELGLKVGSGLPAEGGVDALVDFSAAEASVQHAEAAAARGIATVVGTTGFSESQKARLKQCSERIPLIVAPNFSVGVNVLLKAAAMVAKALGPDYEVEIVEAHHDQKLDAPSGTALALAEHVAAALQRDLKTAAVYGRRGLVGKRTRAEIGIHSVRMGDVVGEHTVYFAIGGERVELSHRATSRDTFARGALRAAKWLAENRKPAGVYTVAQVLGLE